MTREKCEACEGEGVTGRNHYLPWYYGVVCKTCDGTGAKQ